MRKLAVVILAIAATLAAAHCIAARRERAERDARCLLARDLPGNLVVSIESSGGVVRVVVRYEFYFLDSTNARRFAHAIAERQRDAGDAVSRVVVCYRDGERAGELDAATGQWRAYK